MALSIRALAGLARCERPTSADLSASVVQPGRFAHGPEEKFGLAGFTAGAVRGISAMATLPGRKPCVRARCPDAADTPRRTSSSMGNAWDAPGFGKRTLNAEPMPCATPSFSL